MSSARVTRPSCDWPIQPTLADSVQGDLAEVQLGQSLAQHVIAHLTMTLQVVQLEPLHAPACTMPVKTQLASIAAWSDEEHVRANRGLHRKKFTAALDKLSPVLDIKHPNANFYLWPVAPGEDAQFCR